MALVTFIVLVISIYLLNANLNNKPTPVSEKNNTQKTISTINKNTDNSLSPTIENTAVTVEANSVNSDETDDKDYLRNVPHANSEQLRQYIEKNDLCNLKNLQYSLFDVANILINSKGAQAINESDVELINELISTNSAIFKGSNPTDGKHPIVRFYYALYLADLIIGVKTENQKYNTAHDILLDLSKNDPDNGAYTYYRAFLLNKLNSSNEQIKETFLQSFNAPNFDTHLQTITKIIYEQSLTSAGQYAAGTFFISTSPIPNLNEPQTLLKSLIKPNDLVFNKQAEKFAEKISNLSQFKKGSIEFVHYSLLQIAIGLGIKARIHAVEHPGKPLLPRPNTKEITEKINPNLHVYHAFFEEVLKDCNSPNIGNYFNALKAEYSQFLNSK